jgi:hypothetical protein
MKKRQATAGLGSFRDDKKQGAVVAFGGTGPTQQIRVVGILAEL